MYDDYYITQSGNGMPIFHGSRGQMGHGLGSILTGFFRSAIPILRRGLSIFGRQALRTGAQIATDVADGKSFQDSAKNRVSETINQYVPGFTNQSGSGKRRRRTTGRKRKRSDIFDK